MKRNNRNRSAHTALSSSFLVEGGGVPHYFSSMLSDTDRARRYHDALAACLTEWRSKHTGDPTVLDLGVGTGLLSYLVLSLDSRARVLAVDTNRSALDLASKLIGQAHPHFLDRVTFVQTSPGEVPAVAISSVDILVSEILGTLTVSEFAHVYIGLYMKKALRDPSDPYVVPRCTIQYISIHEFPDMPPRMRCAIDTATKRAASVGLYCPTGEGGLGVLLDAYQSRKVAFRVARREDYSVCPMKSNGSSVVHVLAQDEPTPGGESLKPEGRKYEAGRYEAVSLACAQRHELRHIQGRDENGALTVLEWEAILWGEIRLSNTLQGYRELRQGGDAISPLSRNSAWGFFVAPHTVDLSTRLALSTGTLAINYRSPISTRPSATVELSGPYIDTEANSTTEDASASIHLEWVRHVADEDMSVQLAKLTRAAVAKADVAIDRIVVWNDPVGGGTALAIRRILATKAVAVECVYTSSADVWAVARRVCRPHGIPVSVAVNRSSRRGEPFEATTTTLFVAPSRLFRAEKDDLDRFSEARVIPSLPIQRAQRRYRVALPAATMLHGLDVSGSIPLCAMNHDTWSPVRASPFLAFVHKSEEGLQIRVKEPVNVELPTTTLTNLRYIAERRDWPSLYARLVSAGDNAFRCLRTVNDEHAASERRARNAHSR